MSTVLRGARLLDLERETILESQSIKIDDGKISALGSDEDIPIRSTDQIVDCDGRYLLPGLMDMHVHVRDTPHRGPTTVEPDPTGDAAPAAFISPSLISRLHSFLYCGVTSIFDAGNDEQGILELRSKERAGLVVSPRIFCAGAFVTCRGGHGAQTGKAIEITDIVADGPTLNQHIARRPDLLKITYDEHNWGIRPLIPILSEEMLAQIVDYSHNEGVRVTVHVSSELRARQAIAAGADTLAHPVIQSPTTAAFDELVARMNIPVVSTLAIGERYFRLADNPDFLEQPLYATCIEYEERERLRTVEHEAQKLNRWADWMRVMTPVAQENIRSLVAAGGIVASGTDLSLGPELLHELELLQDARLTSWQVLRCATLEGARFLERETEMGSVAVSKVADLILTDCDPSEDVAQLQSISFVMKGGQIVDRAALDLPGLAQVPS